MGKVNDFQVLKMGTCTKEIIVMIKNVVMEFINGSLEIFFMGLSKMTSGMVMVKCILHLRSVFKKA